MSAAVNRRAPAGALRGVAIFFVSFAIPGGIANAAASTAGKTYFFATREACVASGAFTARECIAAFANARQQLRDRAPRFETGSDCRLRFRLCDVSREESQEDDALAYAPSEAVAYTPTALGVEIVATPKGAEAAPTLAVDTPARTFPYFPVSRRYEAQRPESAQAGADPENPAILAADRFEPFSKCKPAKGATTFVASALGAIEGATHDESAEERRARLKAAPFIE